MKTNKIFAFAGALAALVACNKQELPYDLAGTEHAVVVGISKAEGASLILDNDINAGDYRVILDVPKYQGDMSMLKEAQVMAVYTRGKDKKSVIVADGITEFPKEVKVEMKTICSKLGISRIETGDRVELTPCVTLQSGTQVNGWSPVAGFNNIAFTNWPMNDGTPYTYRVAYTAFAPFQKEKFQGVGVPMRGADGSDYGTVNVTQINDKPESYPKGVTADDVVGLKIEGDIWYAPDTIILWINTKDYSVIFPDQVVSPQWTYPGGAYGTYDGKLIGGSGEVDTLNNTLTFSFDSSWGPYGLGGDTIILYFNEIAG